MRALGFPSEKTSRPVAVRTTAAVAERARTVAERRRRPRAASAPEPQRDRLREQPEASEAEGILVNRGGAAPRRARRASGRGARQAGGAAADRRVASHLQRDGQTAPVRRRSDPWTTRSCQNPDRAYSHTSARGPQHAVVPAEEHANWTATEGEKAQSSSARGSPTRRRKAAKRAGLTWLTLTFAASPSPSAPERTSASVPIRPAARHRTAAAGSAGEACEGRVSRKKEQCERKQEHRAERAAPQYRRPARRRSRRDLGTKARQAAVPRSPPSRSCCCKAQRAPSRHEIHQTTNRIHTAACAARANASRPSTSLSVRGEAPGLPRAASARRPAGRRRRVVHRAERRGHQRRGERKAPHSGSSTIIRQPFGVRSSVRIVPSWSSTIQRAIARPSPLPPSPLDRA